MSRLSRDKYFPPGGNDFVDEILRRNANLERRISDLERALTNQDTPQPLPRINPENYPDPYEGQRAIDIADEQHTWYSDGLWRKAGGVGVYEIKAYEDLNAAIVGDKCFQWEIPEDLDQAELIKVEAFVTTPSSSGSVELQIHRLTGTGSSVGDLLTTKITIEAGEYNSKDAASQPVINTAGSINVLDWGDHLRLDVDAAGVDARGLGLIVTVIPSPLGSVTIQGAQGPPGGVTDWTGAWQTATGYTEGQAVSHNGSSYVAIVNHTSGASTEPGVGASWETTWMLLQEGNRYGSLTVGMNANGYLLPTGVAHWLSVPYDCNIIEATLLADITGSIVIDIWKDTYGNYAPTNADSITAAAPLTLSNAIKTTDTSLVGWTTSLTAGDILAFNIDSVTNISKITCALRTERL